MKAICILSHRQPLSGGGFKKYEAGREYDIADPDPAYFRAAGKKQTAVAKVKEEGSNE